MFKHPKLKAYLAFIAVAFFWGTTFLAIRVGITGDETYSFPPFLLAAFRHGIAGILICGYFIVFKKVGLPNWSQFKQYSLNGILMLVGGNGLISWGMQWVDSGLAALISALTPLWIVLLNMAFGYKEKVTKIMWIGFLICLVAQYLIFKDRINLLSDKTYLWGLIAVMASNVCWSLGTIFSKSSKSEFPVLYTAGLQMIPGSIILFIIASINGDWGHFNPSTDSIIALIYLVTFGSLLAYGCFMYILQALPAALVATYAYFNTIVAVLLGYLFLNEIINTETLLAMLLTILGVYLVGQKAKVKEPK
ncbi:MAG: EamA family transporter [Bacteroidota bacterium]